MKHRPRRRKVVHMIGRPRHAYYHVRVFYNGGIIDWMEEGLFIAAAGKSVMTSRTRQKKLLKLSDSSGCCMFPPYKRDHEWDFVKLEDARACFKRLSAFLFAKHPHPMPTRSIELWDERPRMVTARAVVGRLKRVPGGAPSLRRKRRRVA